MDKIETLTPEELAVEQTALKETKEEEVRASIISEYGFDEVDDAEKIEKLVAKELKSSKELLTAIKQKIKYREELKNIVPPTPPAKTSVEEIETIAERKARELFEARDLESLEYPKELQDEISRVSKIQGVSIKQAVADPYIQSKIETYEKQRKTDEASVSRTHRTGSGSGAFDINNPPEVDMATEEGRKKHDEWLERGKKAGF